MKTFTNRSRPPFAGALVLGAGTLICGKASSLALAGGAMFFGIATLGVALAISGGVLIVHHYRQARRSA